MTQSRLNISFRASVNLLNLKWQDTSNAGDCVNSPCLYFPEFRAADVVHMNHLDGIPLDRYDAVIIGGGGLLNEENTPTIERVIASRNKVVLWAIGINSSDPGWRYPDLPAGNVLGWLRHDNEYFPLGPYPSCLHPALEAEWSRNPGDADFEFGVISHKDSLLRQGESLHHITNNTSAEKLIHFIGTHRTIETNSYHAAYFSYLLRRPVELAPALTNKLSEKCIDDWRAIDDFTQHRETAYLMYHHALDWLKQ